MKTRRLLPWTIAASLALHGVAYASLGAPRAGAPQAPRKTQLRFEVKPREAPKPPEPLPPEPPKPKPAARPQPKPEAPQPAPPLPEAAPPPEPASDGVTLAGSGEGDGFSMPLGSGGALTPTRVPSAPAVNVPAPVAPARRRTDPPVVAVADLSSRPAPPSLGAALERNYPAEARRSGSSGSAKVRARIDPDGVVRQVTLLDESAPGFGSACRRTLTGSRWGAPKDKAGHSVATEIRYTCRFVVQP